MRRLLTVLSLVVLLGPAGLFPIAAAGADGVSTVSAESETVSAAPGKSVTVRSACPAGTVVIGGGGECFGFLVTEGWVSLAKSAPAPGEASWYIECTNTNTRPGDIQARAWAVCADPGVFKTKKR